MTEPALARAARLVFRRDLRAHRRGFLLWFVPIAALLALLVALQPSMAAKGGMLEAKLQMMPEGMKQAFGIGAFDLRSPAGYLAVSFLYVTLTATLSTGMLGAVIVAKEEALRTAEVLLAQPVRRRDVLAGKAGVIALHAIAFNVGLAALCLAGFGAVADEPLEPARIASLFAGTLALSIAFGGVGMLVATSSVRPRAAGNAAMGVVLGAYLMSILGAASPSLERVAALSPFHWVAPARILAGGLDAIAVAGLAAIGAACGAVAIVRYERRDILT